MKTCPLCGKQTKWDLVRQMCRACYQRHVRALKKAGTFERRPTRPYRPMEDRILEKTTPGWGGCIIWTARTSDGYGMVAVNRVPRVAHRVLYEILVGPVPDGLELDHTCHTKALECPGGECIHRRCINPHHLEPVTPAENKLRGRSPTAVNARKTHCSKGHEYTEDNTLRKPNGQRMCKECRSVPDEKRRRARAPKERTHCRNGHLLDASTAVVDSNGVTRCLECRRASNRRSKRMRRARKEAGSTL